MTRRSSMLLALLLPFVGANVPNSRPEPTTEIVALFIGAQSCCRSMTPALRPQLDSVRTLLSSRARESGAEFRMVGMSIDWDTQIGWEYLRELGHFDEITVGSNWRNVLAESLIWGDQTADPIVPQLVIYRHQVDTSPDRLSFGPRERLRVLKGDLAISEWVRSGAPLQ